MRGQIFSVTSSLKLLFRESAIQTNSLIILAATLLTFIIDLHLPLGVVAGVLYALVIFASLSVNETHLTHLTAALGFLFTIIAFYLSPDITIPMEIVIINRALTLLLIICTAVMVIRIKKANIDMSTLMTQTLINPITEHKNRHAFEIELDTEILRCKRYHRNLSVAVIDIDHFKIFSNNHDPGYTRDVIKRISRDIKANIRTSDLFYHIDTDAFAILFPETELSEAKEVCEAIRRKVSIKMDKNSEKKITLSIGIAMLGNNDNKINLRQRAEDALITSKINGKNLVSTLPPVVSKEKNPVAAILSRSRSD
ncbi:GGDEF domain-containing protein [Nitrosomonas sp. Nm166]|uniref:GGDEF domain-containing protein n=1 Tax=Nitrosomonas sp. Nm166 TaxID=1881054 RepID=UPI0008F30A40|nr:GGDEF domain-containing protein [Nitrosomonas sp. Nm166]SFE17256.1 diguanylate cyclase (GGDEF) domain-containing protein [Nitrosomonas sp. Nm166]